MVLVVRELVAAETKRPSEDQRPQRAVGFARQSLPAGIVPPPGHSPVFPAYQDKTLPLIGGGSQGERQRARDSRQRAGGSWQQAGGS